MPKKIIQGLYKTLSEHLTDRRFLRKARLTKKAVQQILKEEDWRQKISIIIQEPELECKSILNICAPTMQKLSGEDIDWLPYIYLYIRKGLFPASVNFQEKKQCESAILFYLEVLRVFLLYEKKNTDFDKIRDIDFATDEEIINSHYVDEFHRFRRCFDSQYIYELMRIGREVTNFDLLGHIAGVHFVAMHVARQLHRAGIPIDLGLVSGAAAGHDIGKYGCKDSEIWRIPYLHYYYTDFWFKSNLLPAIGHIATNHSTWDLELEDLPVESLVLIYADFRVKGNRNKDGKEEMQFFTLRESFEVILDKLDNVDFAKENRYRHVYAKLEDFESYMHSLGVNTDFATEELLPRKCKDVALCNMTEIVARLKYMAIEHNIQLMHKLSHEVSFGNVLEAARSSKNWKNSRAYINIFEEYFTYMTQKQKLMTLSFLYELLMHREGDIRRQAADLMGNIIVHYDEDYRKELPDDVSIVIPEITSFQLFQKYLDMILEPDHKVTDIHRRWIAYSLKGVLLSILSYSKKQDREKYLEIFLNYYDNLKREDAIAFTLLDAVLEVPFSLFKSNDIEKIVCFAEGFVNSTSIEVQTALLRFLEYITLNQPSTKQRIEKVVQILSNIPMEENVTLQYLSCKIQENCNLQMKGCQSHFNQIFENGHSISDVFLVNMKSATPWVIKAVNIELLLNRLKTLQTMPVLHVAAHLSNLIKVSEQVTVRHIAGEGLVSMAPYLSLDQRNEVAVELRKGLEIGEYEFSKYIPRYLGEFSLYLHPAELDEFITGLKKLLININERVACVALDTLGVIIQKYSEYKERFSEPEELYKKRAQVILGMILSGLADYRDAVSQEAILVIGQHLFHNVALSLEEKRDIFKQISKKIATLLPNREDTELSFFNNAASLNYIYRFIGDFLFNYDSFHFQETEKIAFFPGTFDPFTLGHKGIAQEIRNLGFTVFLALDEFSWSKKTQPRMIRREIISMSIANEENIYLFPDDIPINIANPEDLKQLRDLFPNKEVYMVAGSDVVKNASSYKVTPVENSIQTFPHILFLRESQQYENEEMDSREITEKIMGDVLQLKLPMHLEDISSTRIRENIDNNRDISNLIDSVAQNYIYEYSLYLREPQYKQVLKAKDIQVQLEETISSRLFQEIYEILEGNSRQEEFCNTAKGKKVHIAMIRDGQMNHNIVGMMLFRYIATTDLYGAFQNTRVANHIRENTSGKIVLIADCIVLQQTNIGQVEQLLLTETLAFCLEKDFTYAVWYSNHNLSKKMLDVLNRQGFQSLNEADMDLPVLVVDMKNPIILFHNIETIMKEPFNRNERILEVIDKAHNRLQWSMTKLYPGELVLSFHASIMHHRLVELITSANGVPSEPLPIRRLGKRMCVPFGKILRGMIVPNTITKVLHTEKTFEPEIKKFSITEYPHYSSLSSQIRTIKSFNRPVILADDLLHKGYRMKELDPIFKEEQVGIDRIIVGVLSGRGKDLMEIQHRKVESVYFIPSIRAWFVESSIYPFVGGDSVDRKEKMKGNILNSINFILPYVMPIFLRDASRQAIYDLSMTCLENALEIVQALEAEYQVYFERNLTLNRLSEVIISPSCPDKGGCLSYDYHLPPSVYIANDIEKLIRLRGLVQ